MTASKRFNASQPASWRGGVCPRGSPTSSAIDRTPFRDPALPNLFTQGAPVAVIAMGLAFVLLLGEIDLSAGFGSGVCAAVMAKLMAEHGQPWWLSLLAGLGTGAVIGLIIGLSVAKVGIPSFVITLAAFLALQGVVLLIIGNGGNISIRDKTIVAIDNNNLSPMLGWLLFALCVGGYGAAQLARRATRVRKKLVTEPVPVTVLRVAAVAVIGGLAVFFLNMERSRNSAIISLRGIPVVVVIVLILLAIWTYVLSGTAFGRHIYAVGGNAEAARRAGISVARVRIAGFVICSTMAGIGGVIAASRATSVDPNAGGSNTLLYAVGAAVIGGTSLFGGKGRAFDALLGGAVVAVVDNGMGLMGYSAGVKFVVTGAILAVAAGVDALSRKRAAATGL
ncbi:ABC transporter permease [Streptomyces sp. SID13666]|uniref:sugar ABC transporter permease n=1 Tax=unclassified Streptomyces TaxID=2593676 RepID=UPI0013C1F7B2|nr:MULTISPECIES: ABC transporter permease [unclassified Streptomyces]NEA58285.1 ABC transporter permease [Streptomyces sp. SID13666]NEA76062.1 ABC transporter permease [Streptomyces sp. SID13588]